jgi:hypothetical protein
MLRVRVPRLATVSGGPGGVIAGTGAAAGSAAALAQGRSTAAASGMAGAAAAVDGRGATIAAASGAAAGTAQPDGRGAALRQGAGSAAGQATVAGVGGIGIGVPPWAARPPQHSRATGRTLGATTGGRRGVATGRVAATLITA